MAREAGQNTDLTYNNYNYYDTAFNLSAVPDMDLNVLIRPAMRRFYLQPSRLFRILRDHPSKMQVIGQGLHFVKRAYNLRRSSEHMIPATSNATPLPVADSAR